MRWIYKTVHYELKKDGFLGPSFLDENEIEESLNEYGKAGWELVSTMEISDGILAIFKQPFHVAKKTPDTMPKKRSADPQPQTAAIERREEFKLADDDSDVHEGEEIGGIRIE